MKKFYLHLLSLLKGYFERKSQKPEHKASMVIQDSLDLSALKSAKKIMVFLTPGSIKTNGGVMSIFSICKFSRSIKSDFFCCIATYPKGMTYVINDKFYNNERILRFDQIVNNAENVQEMILHIPDYYSSDFYNDLSKQDVKFLKSIPHLQINILNQNILAMPDSVEKLDNLYKLTQNITQTIAHRRYASQEICDKWQIPTHLFSTYNDFTEYKSVKFEDKEKIIVLSPDDNEYKKPIVEKLKHEFPDWQFITVNNMTFNQYMDLIARAYFVITFGEGMDGYFNEPSLIGSIGFAVYNDDFFPDKTWAQLKNVYVSYDEMFEKICDDIKTLATDKKLYYKTIQNHYDKHAVSQPKDRFISNLTRFYDKEYDFIPKHKR